MKILIGYDGSPGADAAIEDLKKAGLPLRSDALIVSIADVWLPPSAIEDDESVSGVDEAISTRVLEMRQAGRASLAHAVATSEQGARRVRSIFRDWNVRTEAAADSPAWGILNRANEWRADLIVVGSHGMSALDRLFIGSVSQRVMKHASGAVRVARSRGGTENRPLHLIIGFDGSIDAEAAVGEVALRFWPENTEVHVITVMDERMISALAAKILPPSLRPGPAHNSECKEWLLKMAEEKAEKLRAPGLKTTCFVVEGEPKRVLLKAAADWQADTIFLGSTGLRGSRRLLLGSVSSAVTAHAPCSVEVVRTSNDERKS